MRVFNNQLAADTCKRICDFARHHILNVDTNKSPVAMWTNYGWPQHIVKDSAAVLIFITPREFLEEIQACLEKLGIFNSETDSPLVTHNNSEAPSICLTYVWTRESYIPIHRDGKHRKTVTIYCNEEWSFEKGGIFQWLDSESNTWDTLIPSCGTVILNDKDESHATTPVKSQNDFRISLQIFLLPVGHATADQY